MEIFHLSNISSFCAQEKHSMCFQLLLRMTRLCITLWDWEVDIRGIYFLAVDGRIVFCMNKQSTEIMIICWTQSFHWQAA